MPAARRIHDLVAALAVTAAASAVVPSSSFAVGVFMHGFSGAGSSGGGTPGTQVMAQDFAGMIPGTTYHGSWRAQADAVAKIKAAKAANPDEPVVLVGHSYGGDSIDEVAESLKKCDINVDVYIQIDTYGAFDDTKPCNVECGYNIHSTSGDGLNGESDVDGSTNLPVDGTSHTDIDEKDDDGTCSDPNFEGKNAYNIVGCVLEEKLAEQRDAANGGTVVAAGAVGIYGGSLFEDLVPLDEPGAAIRPIPAPGPTPVPPAPGPIAIARPQPLPICLDGGLTNKFNTTYENSLFDALDAQDTCWVPGGTLEAYLDANEGLLDAVDAAECKKAQLKPLEQPFLDFIAGIPGASDCGSGRPSSFRMALTVTPNPFNPVTTIRFETRGGGRVCLDVYDVRGRRVARLLDGEKSPGRFEVAWDGSGFSGRLPSGVYTAVLTSPEGTGRTKLVIAK